MDNVPYFYRALDGELRLATEYFSKWLIFYEVL